MVKRPFNDWDDDALAKAGRLVAKFEGFSPTAYQLVKQEEFRIVRIGNAIRVSKKSFDEWLESLEL